MQPTRAVIQLADRTFVYPLEVVEDVLLKVNDLIFPADFYILDMGSGKSESKTLSSLLLGRPFMSTARTKIDVHTGIISFEFDGAKVEYNLSKAMKYVLNDEEASICALDSIDSLVEQVHDMTHPEMAKSILENSVTKTSMRDLGLTIDPELMDCVSKIYNNRCSDTTCWDYLMFEILN